MWKSVGNWIKGNAGTGVSIIGALLTGGTSAAIAAGMSLVTGATGTDKPEEALEQLKNNPDALVKLKKLYYDNESSIRKHHEEMLRLELEDNQHEHATTANVIVEGQRVAEKGFEKLSRPLMAWVSLLATVGYAFLALSRDVDVDILVIGIISSPCFAWMGLRSVDKRKPKK